jgi:hypothetical protein
MRAIFLICITAALITGCATLVNQERQLVFFKGGQENTVTKVQTPDGTFDVENGSGSFMMTRSRSDIPIKIMCSNGDTKSDIIQTRFDWLLGGVANLVLTSGWGWFVDPFMPDAYIIPDVSLMGKCKTDSAKAVAH